MGYISSYLEILFVLSISVAQFVHVNGVLTINVNKFSCSKICASKSEYSIPMTYKARSRMECAAECSRRIWCSRYIFLSQESSPVSSPQVKLRPCHLYMDAGSTCSTTTSAPICSKVTDEALTFSQMCAKTTQRVLEVKNSQVYLPMGKTYLTNLLTSENDLKIQFVMGTSKYAVSANYYAVGKGMSETSCASVLDSMAGSDLIDLFIFVRSFCTDGSQTVHPSPINTSDYFYWDIQMNQRRSKEFIFTTAGDRTALVSAVTNGFDMKLLFTKGNTVFHADVITHNKKTSEIAAQARFYENGQLKMVSHSAGGSTEIITWSPPSATLTGPSSDSSETIWFADSCWSLLGSISDLKKSIESGRRIRVKIDSNDLIILATPDYIGINSDGTIIVHILRVIVQKSFASDNILASAFSHIDNLLSGSSKPKWVHFMITSNGSITTFSTDVGSSKYVQSSSRATIQWFEEVHNWTQVHVSYPGKIASLKHLATEVLNRSDVRVVVEVSGKRNWFSCDMVKVVDDGADVKCHVSGQLSLSAPDSNSVSLLGLNLGKILSSTNTIASECFVVSALRGSTGPYSSCLWSADVSLSTIQQPQRVEWFVPK